MLSPAQDTEHPKVTGGSNARPHLLGVEQQQSAHATTSENGGRGAGAERHEPNTTAPAQGTGFTKEPTTHMLLSLLFKKNKKKRCNLSFRCYSLGVGGED